MSNSAALCSSFKSEILAGIHALGTTVARGGTTADTLKAALYFATATITAATTVYTVTGEVTGTNYSAGGITVTNGTGPSTSGTVGIWTPSASLVYGSGGSPLTISTGFDAVLIYNSTQSNKAISVHTFGSQTVTAGIFTLTMPSNDSSNALIRIA